MNFLREVNHTFLEVSVHAVKRVLYLQDYWEVTCEPLLFQVLSYPAHCCGLPEHMVLNILRDISGGLKFLHDHKIIHRDLKPENILLSQQEKNTVFKIADLGYAKQLDEMSIAKSFVGTLQYLVSTCLHKTIKVSMVALKKCVILYKQKCFQNLLYDELMNCFCGMVDGRKAFSLISSWDHCQRSSPLQISYTPL